MEHTSASQTCDVALRTIVPFEQQTRLDGGAYLPTAQSLHGASDWVDGSLY